jgi:16S rRNA (adenine1518-N6/adenine1519-N6)-dimethyltransferase
LNFRSTVTTSIDQRANRSAADDHVVEIGPGLGALTVPLLERLGHLTVIEIDRDLAAKVVAQYPPARLTLHEADALTFDFAALGPQLRVIGNLPYNISTPILFHLAQFDDSVKDLTVMLQRSRAADGRAPGTPEYAGFR